jgi:hypothetical protein
MPGTIVHVNANSLSPNGLATTLSIASLAHPANIIAACACGLHYRRVNLGKPENLEVVSRYDFVVSLFHRFSEIHEIRRDFMKFASYRVGETMKRENGVAGAEVLRSPRGGVYWGFGVPQPRPHFDWQ